MRKKWIISIILCLILIGTTQSSAVSQNNFNKSVNQNEFDTSYHISMQVNNANSLATIFESQGFDVLKGSITDNLLELIVNSNELKILNQQGYEIIILSESRPFREIQNELIENGLMVPPGYPDLDQITDEMNSTASAYPTICMVVDLTTTYDVSSTYEGRHIYAMKISDSVNADEDEHSFLMVSCHHAREIVTPVIALYAIEQFTSEYGSDPDITSMVNNYEIWICPVWNPDGYDYVINVNNMWRKNRHPYYGEVGVDLNRNYPFGWDSACGGSTDPSSETYRGPSAASEEETQTMLVFTHDKHFAKVIDYHSYGREVLYGYACHSHPFTSFFQSEATSISNAAGYSGSIRPPSAEGEHYEWQIAYNGSYANLMETHSDFQPSYSSAQAEAAQVWPATEYILERPISVSGHVTDSVTGEPIEAEITLIGVNFQNGEDFFSEPDYGRYHLFLPSGTYNIKFEATYYQSQTHQITVTSSSSEELDVELVRYNDPPYTPTISGPTTWIEGGAYELIVEADDPEEDDVYYYVDWDDQTTSEWEGPFTAGEQISLYHTYTTSGTYEIKAKAKDVYNEESSWSDSITVTIAPNMIPSDPEIDGSTSGSSGVDYPYTFTSTDAENHDIYYYIDWDDGSCEDWIGPYEAGMPITVSHTWDEKGTYSIQAKAKDEYGGESDWGTLEVKIPRNNLRTTIQSLPLFQRIFYFISIFN